MIKAFLALFGIGTIALVCYLAREGPQPDDASKQYAIWFERPSGAIERKVVDENRFWALRRNYNCKPRITKRTLEERVEANGL